MAKKIAFSLLPLLVLLLLLEVGLRLFPWYKDAGKTISGAAIPDKDLVWRLYPFQDGPYKTNELGLRDTYFNQSANKKILLLGDSVSWGDGIENVELVYPFILEKLLSKNSGESYEVINSSVLGYSTFQELRYLQLYGLKFKPDMILVQFCLNDVVERYSSLFEYGGDNTFMGVDTRGVARGAYGWLLRHSRTFETILRIMKRFGRNYQAYQVEAMATNKPSKEIEDAWILTLSELDEIRKISVKENVPLVIVIFPYRFQLDKPDELNQPQLVLKNYAAENNIKAIDLLPYFSRFLHENTNVNIFFDANHLTIEGHMLTANLLAQQLALPHK